MTAITESLTAEAAGGESLRGGSESLAQLGLSVQTLTAELARRHGVEKSKGVLITAVENGSVASMANLRAGDLIVEADRQAVTNVTELQSAVTRAQE